MGSLFVNSQVDVESESLSQPVVDDSYSNSITFTASTDQISHLADMFSTIASFNNQALMIIRPNGIVIYTEYNHIMNYQVNMDPSLFQFYNFYVKGDVGINSQNEFTGDLRLGIDISLITESFISACSSLNAQKPGKSANSFAGNGNITCYIRYNGDGSPLVIEFEDNLMTERLEFATFYLDMSYPYDESDDTEEESNGLLVNHDKIQLELLLKSDIFSNLLQDLLQINTIELYMYASNNMISSNPELVSSKGGAHASQLHFISKGPIGHSKLIFPNEKTILQKLNIYDTENLRKQNQKLRESSVISCYDFANFIKIFKAVKFSSRCKMLKDSKGVLSIQLLCKNSKLANYPGSLLTCNLLESSPISDINIDGLQSELMNIFEDDISLQLYDTGKQVETESRDKASHNEPKISYSAFKRQRVEENHSQAHNDYDASELDVYNKHNNSEHTKKHTEEKGAAPGVPLFL